MAHSRTVYSRILTVALLLAATDVHAQSAPPALDVMTRHAVVVAAAELLRARYVFPDIGNRAAEAIETALADGAYDDLGEPHAFAMQLTEDLRAAANGDAHLRVFVADSARIATTEEEQARPRSEAGVTRADLLVGNVGYIEITQFPFRGYFAETVNRAMSALSNTSALIVDVRRNRGGDPNSVAYMISHFLDSRTPVLVNEFFSRTPGTAEYTTTEFWSTPMTARSYVGRPVYVLTSEQTISGGEEFAYDMQVMSLGVVVGGQTAGGAHPGRITSLNANLRMFIPDGYPVNPVTGSNWEGVGVIPSITTPVEYALNAALNDLGQETRLLEVDELSEERIFEARTDQDPRTEAVLRHVIQELATGDPNYEMMTPEIERITRQQLPSLRETFSALGPIEAVSFQSIDLLGADVYNVTLANGALAFRIALTQDGRIAMASFTEEVANEGRE